LSRLVRILTLVLFGSLLGSTPSLAEDTKGKWQFGFGLSYFAVTDYIRSNADIAISKGVVGATGLPPVTSVDDRPDINILNEPSISDDFKIDFNASYGLTRWLALEMTASYFKSEVGNIEYFFKDQTTFVAGSSSEGAPRLCGPNPLGAPEICWIYTTNSPVDNKVNTFLPVGELTTLPLQLSGVVRFRPESPLDPYVGMGFGYIFTDLQQGQEFTARSNEVDNIYISSGYKGDYTQNGQTTNCGPNQDQLCSNIDSGPMTAEISDAFQWHALAGVDYYVNDKFSFYVDARYVWTSGSVDIRVDGAEQVRFSVTDEGQILLRSVSGNWEDTGFLGRSDCQYPDPLNPGSMRSCAGDGLLATEDKFGGKGPDGEVGTEDDGPPVQNGRYEPEEDDGVIYLLPINSRDHAERVGEFHCPSCVGNGPETSGAYAGRNKDTEDKNGNGALDTYLLYGIDICTTPEGAGHPRCTSGTGGNITHYVWPEGCANAYDPGSHLPLPDENATDEVRRAILSTITNQGCPPVPAPGATPGTTTFTDNASDLYIIQGGDIRLGGFSLGLGMKFLF
jgi:outer membrane protein W